MGDRFYDLAIISYILAFGHFASEALVFKTAGPGPGLFSPIIVASESVHPCTVAPLNRTRRHIVDLDDES